jgi:hypothetical protein
VPATSSLTLTAIPTGFADDATRSLRVSLVVSPRLAPGGDAPVLDSFRDFLDWPATLAQCEAVITLGDRSATVPLSAAGGPLGAPDSRAWQALFPATTPVRAFTLTDRTGHRVLSYDTVGAHALVERAVAEATLRGGSELPTASEWLTEGRTMRAVVDALFMRIPVGDTIVDRHRAVRRVGNEPLVAHDRAALLAAYDTRRGVQLPGAGGPVASLLATAELFHMPHTAPQVQGYTAEQAGDDPGKQRARWLTHARAEMPTAAQLVDALDFHRIVAALNQYPRLLRLMGLVLDVTVPRSAFLQRAQQPLTWRLERRGRRIRQAPVALETRYRPDAFEPVSHGDASDGRYVVEGGLLRLDGRFALLQADVDGALLSLAQFGRSLHAMVKPLARIDAVTRAPKRTGAPPVRTAGLQLVHSGRAVYLERTFALNAERDQRLRARFLDERVAPPRLHWEDVVRGWRVDVWDDTVARWHSLCEREARYVLGDGALVIEAGREEGTVRLGATTAADGSSPGLLSLHEAVATWAGWSLCVRPPGRAVGRAFGPDDTVRDGAPDVPPGLRLRADFAIARGTLPRLRYARSYAMRVRAVDLAGNSLPPRATDFRDDEPTTALTPFWRLDPILAPAIAMVRAGGALVSQPRAGESLACVAIRTMNDRFDDATPSPDEAVRALAPVRTTVREAERHGLLDANGAVDAAAWSMLTARDAELPGVTLAADATGPAVSAPVHDVGAALPYLPDPLCTRIGARFVDHPAIAATTLVELPLYAPGTRWPEARPVVVRVREGTGAPAYDAARHELVVPLPKGVRCTCRLACLPSAEALTILGPYQWARERLRQESAPPVQLRAFTRRVERGEAWAITPWVELDLVHATQRPLVRPDATRFDLVPRARDATHADYVIHARCSVETTGRIDVNAIWSEPRADVDGPVADARTGVAATVPIADPRRYRPEPGDDMVPEHEVVAPGIVALSLGTMAALQGRVGARRHEFGDTRYRRVGYVCTATSRFRDFMPRLPLDEAPAPGARDERPLARTLTVHGMATRIWVPSTASPPAPEVAYVVPTFGWLRTATPAGERRVLRRGRGLRIWLAGPWNASGWGEMLAVVLLPEVQATAATLPDVYRRTATLWGNDPYWQSPSVAGYGPRPRDFVRARTAPDPSGAWLPDGVSIVEADQRPGVFAVQSLVHPAVEPTAATGRVDIAPHDVHWDAARGLWYCDVEIANVPAYAPFVRLALARYQPTSIDGAHLSPVVTADLSMLLPDRWLVLAPPAPDGARRVTLHGPTHTGNGARPDLAASEQRAPDDPLRVRIAERNPIEAWIERFDPQLGEDFGWQRVPTLAVRPPVAPVGPVAQRPAPPVAPVPRPAPTRDRRRDGTLTAVERRYADLTYDPRPLEAIAEVQFGLVDAHYRLFEGIVPPVPGGTRHRLVVAEYEEYLADDPTPYDSTHDRADRRIVFVEHLEL